jgi:methenyltetrahydrofolate cyclohydrolase
MNSEKQYLSRPIREFLDDLATKCATPGGGSAAALVGSVSTAAARMVIQYTVGKPKFAASEARLRELLEEFKRAGQMFEQLLSEDMAAYEKVAEARRAKDDAARQQALGVAIAVPMEMVVLAEAVTARIDEIKSIVNPFLLSDLRTAAILAEASARSASMNVLVNAKDLTNAVQSQGIAEQVKILVARAADHRDSVLSYSPA